MVAHDLLMKWSCGTQQGERKLGRMSGIEGGGNNNMPQKTYKQLAEDVQEILGGLAKMLKPEERVEPLTGKVIAISAVVKQLLDKLDEESAG